MYNNCEPFKVEKIKTISQGELIRLQRAGGIRD